MCAPATLLVSLTCGSLLLNQVAGGTRAAGEALVRLWPPPRRMPKLSRGLSRLGLSPNVIDTLCALVAERQWPMHGALSRVSQMQHLVDKGVLTQMEVPGLLESQPNFLQCEFRTAYEDHRLVATDKPFQARLHTMQSSSLSRDTSGPRWPGEATLHEHLQTSHPECIVSKTGHARLCHQLDFATSGLIVAAKSREAANSVMSSFKKRTARKLYAALVHGHPKWDSACWQDPIERSPSSFKQCVTADGKPAETAVTVGARGTLLLGEHAGKDASLLWLEPKTGRRHQLRGHCAHHQHAIVGDVAYAGDRLAYRMFLHAAALSLPLDDGTFAAAAPLEPVGWSNAFEPLEAVKGPPSWENPSYREQVRLRL